MVLGVLIFGKEVFNTSHTGIGFRNLLICLFVLLKTLMAWMIYYHFGEEHSALFIHTDSNANPIHKQKLSYILKLCLNLNYLSTQLTKRINHLILVCYCFGSHVLSYCFNCKWLLQVIPAKCWLVVNVNMTGYG